MSETEIKSGPETYDIELCTDCLMFFANGETEGIDVHYWHPAYRDAGEPPPMARGYSPEETEIAESRFLAAVEQRWPAADGWVVAPGCPTDCEWCHGGYEECSYCAGAGCERCDGRGYDDVSYREQCEPHFSWRACQGCGSTLGGDRSRAVAWRDR